VLWQVLTDQQDLMRPNQRLTHLWIDLSQEFVSEFQPILPGLTDGG